MGTDDLAARDDANMSILDSGGDCQHGCNGDCYDDGGPRCDFTCHENRCENCTGRATMWLDTGWFCSYECDAEYGEALWRSI